MTQDTREPLQGPALLADIGGTNARFALLDDGKLGDVLRLPAAGFAGPAEAAAAALQRLAPRHPVRRAVIAAAGPVADGRCVMSNLDWVLDRVDLAARLALDSALLLNDFEAVGWSLPALTRADLRPIGGDVRRRMERVIAIGPGTGLGVVAVRRIEGRTLVLPTEAGHMTLSANDERQRAIVAAMAQRFPHVSVERVLSGPGLTALHGTLAAMERRSLPPRQPSEIMAAGLAGACPVSAAALELFVEWLGSVAGDLVLAQGAWDGVYLVGNIANHLADRIADGGFRRAFEAKGRMSAALAATPVWLVTAPDPAFIGLREIALRKD